MRRYRLASPVLDARGARCIRLHAGGGYIIAVVAEHFYRPAHEAPLALALTFVMLAVSVVVKLAENLPTIRRNEESAHEIDSREIGRRPMPYVRRVVVQPETVR